jgi:hypothetical protein
MSEQTRLGEIKARRDAVSQPAPWFRSRVAASGDATVRSHFGNRPIARVRIGDHDMVGLAEHIEAWDETHAATQADAEFIAHAPADIDWLVEQVEHWHAYLRWRGAQDEREAAP